MAKKKAVRTVDDAIKEAQAGLREEATATAKPLPLDQITKAIAEKEATVDRLQEEIAKLREDAIMPIQELALAMGYSLVRHVDLTTPKPKKAATAKAATADKTAIADWLRANAKNPVEKVKLVELFKSSGLGQRLRLDKYEDVVTVSADGIVTLKK